MKNISADHTSLLTPTLFVAEAPTAFNGVFIASDNLRKAVPENCLSSFRRLALQFFTFALLGLPLIAAADSSGAKLLVSATVIKHASLQVLVQPKSVLVTAADIARGYVDVMSPAQVAVQSNTPSGYLLIFESQGEFLRQTLIKGLGAEVQLGASGGGVTHRPSGRGMSKTVHDLEFRFLLSNSAQQGLYAWPLSLSVMPL